MPLKNADSLIAFTSVASNTYADIIVGHVEADLVRKHFSSPLSTPVTAFTFPFESEALVAGRSWPCGQDGGHPVL